MLRREIKKASGVSDSDMVASGAELLLGSGGPEGDSALQEDEQPV